MSASAPLLIERRNQYLEYLLDALRLPIHRRVREWLDVIAADKKRKPQALKHFQDVLSKVSGWNSMRVASETAAVVRDDDADYLPQLVSALVTVETKIFLLDEAVDAKDVAVRTPTLDAFVHTCFIETARQLWKNIALFDPALSKLEQQKNYVTTDGLIAKAIKDAVRRSLPIKDIVQHVALPIHTPSPLRNVPIQPTPVPPSEIAPESEDEDEPEPEPEPEDDDFESEYEEEAGEAEYEKNATTSVVQELEEQMEAMTPSPSTTSIHKESESEGEGYFEYDGEEEEEEEEEDTKSVVLNVPKPAAAASVEVKKKSFY